jgi:hypothetical protein
MVADVVLRERLQALFRDWTEEADAAGLTDFYGLQALACRAMLEGGEALVRLRHRRIEDGLVVPLQLQVLEPEHLPVHLNTVAENGNVVRAGIEFDRLGRRVAYHLYRSHPEDGALAPMSGAGGLDTVRVPAGEIIHLYRPLRPARSAASPGWRGRWSSSTNSTSTTMPNWCARRPPRCSPASSPARPEDNLMGEGLADAATGWRSPGWSPARCRSWSPAKTSSSPAGRSSAGATASSCACSSARWPPRWASPTSN